ncbi:Rrf2 family transcriptional regulator [Acidovorax sp. MR-S7]|uniref:Rrf2 family transcriptional regulator n=1 Tax=Acidovorax sp. MR-S7 TaxID=1268622 RepID=UPI0003791B76|nr:Rrf2 family transcriptional regulator [Acidovorax sp. MR-S7]
MRLTTRGKLAVTALTDLALRSHGQPVALPSISARQGISLSYLEDIFSALRRAGIVSSIRGPGGGYTLLRPPQELSVADIVLASEKYMPRPAGQDEGAPQSGDMTAELWANFHSRVMEYLQSITVADLLAQQQAGERTLQTMQVVSSPSRTRAVKTQLPAQNVPNSVFALGLPGAKLKPS